MWGSYPYTRTDYTSLSQHTNSRLTPHGHVCALVWSFHVVVLIYFITLYARRARKDTALAAPVAQCADTGYTFWPRTERGTVRYFSPAGAGPGRSGVFRSGFKTRLCKVNKAPDPHTSSREPGALAPSISALCRSISAYKSQAVPQRQPPSLETLTKAQGLAGYWLAMAAGAPLESAFLRSPSSDLQSSTWHRIAPTQRSHSVLLVARRWSVMGPHRT